MNGNIISILLIFLFLLLNALEPAPKSTPIPWFNKHVDTSKKQTALQENESTNYVIGIMSDSINYEELPEL